MVKEAIHKSKHKGIVYYTTTIGGSRWLRVFSEANNADIVRLTGKPVQSIRDMIKYFEMQLGAYDWSHKLSEGEIANRDKWYKELWRNIFVNRFGRFEVDGLALIDVDKAREQLKKDKEWVEGFLAIV